MQTLTPWALTGNHWQLITQASQYDARPTLPKAPLIYVKVSGPRGRLETDYPTAHSNEVKRLRSAEVWPCWDIVQLCFPQVQSGTLESVNKHSC